MARIHNYNIRLPYPRCEDVMNNCIVSETIAAKRDLHRSLDYRQVDGKTVSNKTTIALLKPGQVYRERQQILSLKAGKMQKAYGFEQWQQDYKMEKTGATTARCVDSILWKKTGTTAKRTYTLRDTGNAVMMSLDPWVINLQNISILLQPMIRSQMNTELKKADAEFPEMCEQAARNVIKKRAA